MRLTPNQRDAREIVASGRFYPDLVREEDGWYARWRVFGAASEGVVGWVDEYVRSAAMTRLSEDAEDDRHETLHDAWIMALKSRTGLVRWDDAECAAFAADLAVWHGGGEEDTAIRKAITFTLAGDAAGFTLTTPVPCGRRALKALGQATFVSGLLRDLRLKSADGPLMRPLSRAEAEEFVRNSARELQEAGYSVVGTDLAAPITAAAEEVASTAAKGSEKTRFKLTVRVAGQPVTIDEIRFLLEQNSTLVFFRDHWIDVDRNILKQALRAMERGLPKGANVLSFALGIGHIGRLEIESLRTHGWLRGLVNELRNVRHGEALREAARMQAIPALKTDLRAYQREGVAWLRFLTDHGFGALLADDMGLGKTVQTIAWLLATKDDKPALVVAPLTLLANWRHEIETFAPSLKVYVHQGASRHVASGFARTVHENDIVLTSYNLLVRDHTTFGEVEWSALVIDEAQAIKNPDTQAARAILALAPKRRVALTGTPIENSVEDLWSIEEFLNPGFLGERAFFRERFVRPLAYDPAHPAGAKLKRALEPFVMRRLKTDPAIACELGEKREIREYCVLDGASRAAYENALAAFRATAHAPGDALALLTELKHVCDGGGKEARLIELVRQIFDAQESCLIFTQYVTVGQRIAALIRSTFGVTAPFLHGGVPPVRRETLVRGFMATQRPMAFVLSLKTGGFGLNLTKATHVIHYDRWWNPATENQATDRAHRIGQEKDVFVHLMVTEGTIEERIDGMLRRKESLKSLISDTQEFWKAVKLA